MDTDKITAARKKIFICLKERRLRNVFKYLGELLAVCKNIGFKEKVEELETTYKYMIKYMLEGVEDPEREKLYKSLLISLYAITDKITDELMMQSASSFYYDKRRYCNLNGNYSLSKQTEILKATEDKLSLSTSVKENDNNITTLRKATEDCQEEIFLQLLVNYNTTDFDYEISEKLLNPTLYSTATVCLAVSAIMLSILHNYDERKILILLDTYSLCDDEEIKQRALCGALIVCYFHRDRITFSDTISERIGLLTEDVNFSRDVRNQFIQLIRTMETERITDIFTREILPEMMKMSPELYKKMSGEENMADDPLLEKNPEWEKMLNSSGVTKKLQELNELQIEGSDVLMSTFSSLKNFPFFNKISNWFKPFSTKSSDISNTFANSGNFTEIIEAARFICNSDKYSLSLAMGNISELQRNAIMNQLPGDKNEVEDAFKNELDGTASIAKSISNQYIQDLYRFFKLAPQKIKEQDIFSKHIDLYEVAPLQIIFSDDDTMRLIGEFYLKKEYFSHAEKYFTILSERIPEDTVTHQKLGYCKQMQKDYKSAIEEYLKAESISPDFWTLHHIATCYRADGYIKEALKYYGEALRLKPDNLVLELQCGHCYLTLGDCENALKHYFKVEYLANNSMKAWRAIAWCSFIIGKTAQAESYYEKILSASPTANDYMNAGHTALALKKTMTAFELYQKSLIAGKNDIETFLHGFNQDRDTLKKLGISDEELSIMLDQLMYQSEN
ncbi:MAG: hypothetical protein RRY55_00260 [Bacteroidales bacterium]